MSKPPPPPTPSQDGELIAAIDLGSNSFHMVIARVVGDQLRIIDRLRETVRMADGLGAKGGLSRSVRQRAIACLERFGQRIRALPDNRIRALATNTVRRLRCPQNFLVPAERALGHGIEIVSGREEARLIYLGVAHALPPKPQQNRLVIDIGGGSTEFIIGRGMQALERESLQAGCIASTHRYFPNGKLSKKRWRDALTDLSTEFQQFANQYRKRGWQEAIGSSGTHKAIGEVCLAMNLTKGAITAKAISALRDELLTAKQVKHIQLPGLSSERRPIIAGGVLILEAAFETLHLEQLTISKAAMREGILYDLAGRGGENDPRETSIATLMRRYEIDTHQAQRVAATTHRLFEQVRDVWELHLEDAQQLNWAAHLHELGLAIAHSQYHVHGSYILEHSDIAGFSREEQQILAILVRVHRRALPKGIWDALAERLQLATRRKAALLRIAVALHRSHQSDPIPTLIAQAKNHTLNLILDRSWLEHHPLLRTDLISEIDGIAELQIHFRPRVMDASQQT